MDIVVNGDITEAVLEHSDSGRVVQVIENILSNAAKYARDTEISIVTECALQHRRHRYRLHPGRRPHCGRECRANKRSRNMEVAALVLSIIAIASCSCIYVSIICGSLAMIFALLSKGGATSMSSMAMTSFWIAFAAIVITLIVYIGSFAAMLHEYGSIEGILKEYQNLTGIDYNELLKQMNTAK